VSTRSSGRAKACAKAAAVSSFRLEGALNRAVSRSKPAVAETTSGPNAPESTEIPLQLPESAEKRDHAGGYRREVGIEVMTVG